MRIRSFDELTTADPLSLRFTPLGFAGAAAMTPEAAAEFQQQVIAATDLTDEVPDSVRESFERLRELHSYGVLCYETYTVAHDQAWLVLEQALRVRFMSWFSGRIPLVDTMDGDEEVVFVADDFDAVYASVVRGGTHSGRRWKLKLRSSGRTIGFHGSLGDLQRWARAEGLLHGQRNRRLEWIYPTIRNAVAHPTAFHRTGPVESMQVLRDLAEVINRLWGAPTPGGRLYPAPIERELIAIGWAMVSGSLRFVRLRSDQLATLEKDGDWTFIVVRASVDDDALLEFDTEFERTTYPSELVCGPGRQKDVVARIARSLPATDTATYLDRLFVIRIHEGKLSLPRRPATVVALPEGRRRGYWRLVRADFPNDAFAHVRHIVEGASCAVGDPRNHCPVDDIAAGRWAKIVHTLRVDHGIADAASPPSVRVPRRWNLPEHIRPD